MKPSGVLKVWMPLVGLGAVLILAPQSRAQEVSPDHFDENGMVDAKPAKPVAKAKPVASTQAQSKKPGSKAASQTTAAKNSSTRQAEVVAVSDKKKMPARKPEQQQ